MRRLIGASGLLAMALSGFAPIAAAQAIVPPPPLESRIDYVDGRHAPKATRLVGTPCTPCWGEEATYTTFSSPVQTYAVRRYDGHAVTLLVPVEHPRKDLVTERRLRTLVDRLDILYAGYSELLGWEPAKSLDPSGRQVFAFRQDDPSSYYGIAYVPGDSSEYSNAVLEEVALDDDFLSNVWVHELAHNFDPIGHWDYGPDSAHDWTTLIQNWYARQQMRMDDSVTKRWFSVQDGWLASHWLPWLQSTTLTWSACAATSPRPAECDVDGGAYLRGSLDVVLARQLDGAQVRDWLRAAVADKGAGLVVANDPTVRSDYALNLLATVTGSDTRCVIAPLRWSAGPALDAAGAWSTPFAGCRDDDHDGVSRFFDCDDSQAAVYPGATEIADGRDNDCDEVTDEKTIREADQSGADFNSNLWAGTPYWSLPLVAEGALQSATDVDSFAFEVPMSTVRLRLCAEGGPVSVGGVTPQPVAWGPLLRADPGQCRVTQMSSRAYRSFYVESPGDVGPATYTFEIGPGDARPWPRQRPVRLVTTADGIRAEVRTTDLAEGSGELRLRWFASGAGFLRDLPLSDPASLQAPVLPASLLGDPRLAVQLRAQLWRGEMPVDEPSYPVTVNRPAYALGSGEPYTLTLDAGREHPRLFIDVPVGATRLTITSASASNVDLFVTPTPAPATPWTDPNIDASPDPVAAPHRAVTAGGDESLVIEGVALTPGRWYIVPRNLGATAAVTVTATIEATATSLPTPPRPGSYFNSDRSGHGVFLYPAGDQWAGLWYAYLRDGSPTWYYLQGAKPGTNGLWTGAIYRSKWDGDSNALVRVGEARVTPTGPDRFTWSFNLDGETGSEPMQSLGRGCPMLSGTPVDASGNWFDPVRAGTGHSAQFWADGYQFFASFLYDADNEPRFVTAEQSGIGNAQQALLLEQLQGFCPLCQRRQAPLRFAVGELGRTIVADRLQEILVTADYAADVPGEWNSTDQVVALGEDTQGCDP